MRKKRKQDFAISEINNAVPIQNNSNQNNQNENYEIELDDQQQIMQENISTVEQWNKQLNEWNEMLEQEEIAQIEDININNHGIISNELLELYTHPAVNENAKWDLRDV